MAPPTSSHEFTRPRGGSNSAQLTPSALTTRGWNCPMPATLIHALPLSSTPRRCSYDAQQPARYKRGRRTSAVSVQAPRQMTAECLADAALPITHLRLSVILPVPTWLSPAQGAPETIEVAQATRFKHRTITAVKVNACDVNDIESLSLSHPLVTAFCDLLPPPLRRPWSGV